MLQDLKGKTALISGAGKKTGIGFAMARKLASLGTHVIIADLGKDTSRDGEVKTGTREEMDRLAAELAETYRVRTLAVDLDVTSAESVARMVETVRETVPRLDVLCNNAGAAIGVPSTVHTYDEAAWIRTVDVNLHGVFRVSKALLPLMMEKGGSIVNTASRAGKVPPLFNGAYAVAKAGVIMLTKVMARELGGTGIRVNAICPGQIMTDLERWSFELEAKFLGSTVEARIQEMCKTIPLARIGDPEEVAKLTAFLASDASSYMTGQAINVTGGQLMEL
jgi:NAD(P)-dependent dehydrogenase (short-subunit alcohol dehydrogenase family)